MGNQGHKLEPDELTEAWTDFKIRGQQEARNRLVMHYMSLVRVVARKVAVGLPRMVDREDLTSYGLFGLLDAIDKYDLGKNVKFETYAVTRIKGSIIDEIRSLDWVPRTVRARARDVDRAETELHAQLGRPPEDSEVAGLLNITLIELWALQSQAANTQPVTLTHSDQGSDGSWGMWHEFDLVDRASNPEDLFEAHEVLDMLAEAIDHMPQRAKTILVLYYFQEMTLAEIGTILGVTESRVCQLQSKLLQTLHGSLSTKGAAAA